MNAEKWIWMPHAAHYICGHKCRFHLATYVGEYIVSTVGERMKELDLFEFEDIGPGMKYETMVFYAEERTENDEMCCPYKVSDFSEIDCQHYNTSVEAYNGHMELCRVWSEKACSVKKE